MPNNDAVRAYLRLYTREQIETVLRNALADRANMVTITSTNFESGGSSGIVTGKTEVIISEMLACLDAMDAGSVDPLPRQMFVPVNFSMT